MNTEPIERGGGRVWEAPPFSPLAEMSAQLKGSGYNLFFRLARQRADYFADVEDIPTHAAIDELPTQRASAYRRAIEAIATQPDVPPRVEQPTGLLQAWARI